MKAKTDTAGEFTQGYEPIAKALQRLVHACLTSSAYKSDGGALDAARKAMDKRWAVFAKRFASHADFAAARHHIAQVRARLGDDFFYDRGNYREAITEYAAALALEADCLDALSGIVATYLQGTLDPAAALPYAIRRAELDPARQRDVEYIRQLPSKR